MKYIMWESANFRNPKLAQALKDESYSVGKNIYFTMHEVVGQFFDYGTWWNQGYTGLPYEFDTSLADFMHDCKLKDEEEKKIEELIVVRASKDEKAAHFESLAVINDKSMAGCLWIALDRQNK